MVAARTGTDGTARRSGPGAHTSLEATWRPSASVISRMLDTQRFPLGRSAPVTGLRLPPGEPRRRRWLPAVPCPG